MRPPGSTPPREIHTTDRTWTRVVGPRASARSHALAAWREHTRWRIATRRRTARELAGSSHFEPPLSQLDCILASPLLGATQERFEGRLPAPRPGTSSMHIAGLLRVSMRLVVARLQLTDTMLRHNLASLFGRGLIQFDDQLRLLLMFALSGLAVTLFLAAKTQGISAALTGISMGF